MRQPATLFDKLWASHEIVRRKDGETLLWVDRHYVHEGSFHAFGRLAERGAPVAEPGLTFGVADHYVPTRGSRQAIANPEIARMVRQLEENAARHHIKLFGLDDPRQGIVHVVGPEQGLTLPGLLIVCGDSHTSTHGALGACAFGIGASEVAHVLMTQTIWQNKPKQMRINVEGVAAPGIGAKDIVLAIIAKIGAGGAIGHAIEYAGSAIRALTIEGRLTLCNMSIEAGARCGMVAPDAVTFAYVKDRPFAPKGAQFEQAAEAWSALASDTEASFDREVTLDAGAIAPIVTWGTSPEDALPIDASVPDPARETDAAARELDPRCARLYGAGAGSKAHRRCHRPRVHRLLHQRAHRRPARRGGRAERTGEPSARPRVTGFLCGETPGRTGRARPHLSRRGPRMGGVRLLHVRRHQRRPGCIWGALRINNKPQFPRSARSGCAHAPDVAGNGGGGGRQR